MTSSFYRFYASLNCVSIASTCSGRIRFSSTNSSSPVRVRFAPSPTGHLHLGGLRTLVFNYIFAKQQGGSFILRIEDTDRKRLVQGSVEGLREAIAWTGITPNEGPSFGGNFGPYLQSERLDLYKKEAEDLVEKNFAYKCFCSEDRLLLLRNEALKNREAIKYDGKCRHLSQREIDEKLQSGQRYVIRFKLDSIQAGSFKDLVYDHYEYNFSNEGDFVLIKSDNYPTYHFANVVDDHHMQISHVLRGVEWLDSTPKHLAMYKAFSWQPPNFAHLPLLMGGKTKLSKRDGAAFVQNYRNRGYYPLALINSVCSTGGGFTNRDKHKLYELDELIELFDINSISRHGVRFEMDWLNVYNGKVLAEMDTQSLVPQMKEIVLNKFGKYLQNLHPSLNVLDDGYVEKIISYCRQGERIYTLNDLVVKDLACFWHVPDEKFETLNMILLEKSDDYSLDMLESVIDLFVKDENAKNSFKQTELSKKLKVLASAKDWKHWKLFSLLRAALNGGMAGPPVVEIMELLGYDLVVERLKHALRSVNQEKTERKFA